MKIYTPTTLEKAKEICSLLDAQNPLDLLKCHAAFGHHFNGDIGAVMMQSYCLKGKPSLNADAMAGICRASGLVRYIRQVEWTDTVCIMEMARTDEPSDVVHRFTYSMEMANRQGLTRNRNWQQMPLQMLRARCLTMGLRATYPDAVAGIYSADEIADNMDISDEERTQISAEALGEEVRFTRKPQRAPAPKPSAPPQPAPAPQPEPEPEPEPEPVQIERPDHDFTTVEGFWAVVEASKIERRSFENIMTTQKIDIEAATPEQRERAWYRFGHPSQLNAWSARPLTLTGGESEMQIVADLCKDHPVLSFLEAHEWAHKLGHQAFGETLLIADELLPSDDRSHRVLKGMSPNDWSAYDFLYSVLND